jgi:hypothetical protein
LALDAAIEVGLASKEWLSTSPPEFGDFITQEDNAFSIPPQVAQLSIFAPVSSQPGPVRKQVSLRFDLSLQGRGYCLTIRLGLSEKDSANEDQSPYDSDWHAQSLNVMRSFFASIFAKGIPGIPSSPQST